jgi:hypothetical protein
MLVPVCENKWSQISDDKNYSPFTLGKEPNIRVKEIIGVYDTLSLVI